MKFFNSENVSRHKSDLKLVANGYSGMSFDNDIDKILESRDSMIYYGIKVVERTVRGFSMNETASGVLTIEDLLQDGYIGLIEAIDNIDVERIRSSANPSWSFESFIYQRIFGSIRRSIYINRSGMKMSERKIIEMQKEGGENNKMVQLFFNCIFDSIDKKDSKGNTLSVSIEDKVKEYNIDFMYKYLLGLINKHLSKDEAMVITLMYGLDGEKRRLKDIGLLIGMGNIPWRIMYVKLSELKESAINKLSEKIDKSIVVDFLNG
jgi:DNA-directed RNA polymerase specialized sigma subunit